VFADFGKAVLEWFDDRSAECLATVVEEKV
jgi:hypothetical protein